MAISITELATFLDLVVISPSFPVENCICPEGHAGQSCQDCIRGYVRASGNPADSCIPCACNGLSLDCEAITGICINCTGNSEGDNCERCEPGFFGDPTQGIPCLPCECPSTTRSFSETCILDIATNDSVCDACAVGYTGQHCELCMDGYYGNPLVSYHSLLTCVILCVETKYSDNTIQLTPLL